ncbi:hypothetical protein MBLNU459_g4823t1 [Dothideomycetes sp. NU459]
MAAPPFKVKAVYEYASPHDDDLSFPNGQVITVTEEEDADWYVGEYVDAAGSKHSGLFPKNFVEKYEPAVPSRPTRAPRPVSMAPVPPPPAPAEEEADAAEEAQRDVAPALPVQSKPAPPPLETSVAPAAAKQDTPKSPPAPAAAPPALDREPPSAPKPTPAAPAASGARGPPPPVSEKPSSFKDRIAAFNKGTAAPTPFKPAAPPGGFIKKPFVAPPPSKNAYIPPPRAEPTQKVYIREEDPEIHERQAQDQADAEKAGLMPSESAAVAATTASSGAAGADEAEDAPKPQSLKERIALLQKQQLEQAARRADGGQKEKPKKPVKRGTDLSEKSVGEDADAAAELEPVRSAERPSRPSADQPRDLPPAPAPAPTQRGASVEPRSPGFVGHEQELLSDANDADMSAAGEATEDNDVDSDDTEPAPANAPAPTRQSIDAARAPAAPRHEAGEGDEEDGAADESEEDEMDAETRRRMELRERMAKMSGGMGMAGMFGPAGGVGMPGMGAPPPKKRSTKEANEVATSPPQRLPMMPIPGMQSVRSPDPEDRPLEVEKEDEPDSAPISSQRGPAAVPDVEDIKPQPPARVETFERAAPPVPSERPLSSPTVERGAPPIPGSRPVPAPPALESRPPPPPPPAAGLAQEPSDGEESDDEMPTPAKRLSADAPLPPRPAPPPVSTESRPANPRSPPSVGNKRASYFGPVDPMSPMSPVTPGSSDRRASRIPPIPGSSPVISTPTQTRLPPPPPPSAAPPSHIPPVPSRVPTEQLNHGESEYEGDYDTDIASGVKHKDALKSHGRDDSVDGSTFADDTPIMSPAIPTPLAGGPRAVPPPPPPTRMSLDAPRAAPPPPPPRDASAADDEEDYEEPNRSLPIRAVPPPPPSAPAPLPVAADFEQGESSDDMYSTSPPRRSMDRAPPPPPHAPAAAPPAPSQAAPPAFPTPSRQPTRQSLDVSRPPAAMRRSMDQPRGNDGYIATEIDVAEESQWWTQPDMPPPVFQNRNDVLVEIEESSTSRRGGKTTISKDVYTLFIDYSQTVIIARFDSRDPGDVAFEQRHETPPPRLRQDQLEAVWQRFGSRISEAAAAKKDAVVGDGSPNAFVLELLRAHKDALLPVGTRAYGALVYANLANASVQQFDEIRPGDIITLRNAKLSGKAGTMHHKYAVDVGMGSGHVAVVAEWDGTKKKVRAWEQGREKAKVKLESFRLGDLRSGEVRVWRVVGRNWVGWDSNSA